jgi:hypothetical protein
MIVSSYSLSLVCYLFGRNDRGRAPIDRNPYAPSQATLKSAPTVGGDSSDVWRDGKWLVMNVDARLPHRCVKCNEAAEMPMRRQSLYWHHPAIYLLLLFWIVIYVIVALIARRSVKLEVGLCEEHRVARRKALTIGSIGLIGSAPAGIGLAELGQPGFGLLLGIGGFFGFAIYLMIKARILYAKKIDEDEARIGGCGEEFLSSLPSYRG